MSVGRISRHRLRRLGWRRLGVRGRLGALRPGWLLPLSVLRRPGEPVAHPAELLAGPGTRPHRHGACVRWATGAQAAWVDRGGGSPRACDSSHRGPSRTPPPTFHVLSQDLSQTCSSNNDAAGSPRLFRLVFLHQFRVAFHGGGTS